MFEAQLKSQLKNLFGLSKVTYDQVSDATREQEGVFIEIDKANVRLIDARQIAHVTGQIRVFAQAEKMPYGFLSKRLAEASAADLRGLFFHDFEENKGSFMNIHERAFGFVYLFDSQYDPAVGTLTEINLEISES